MKTSALIIAMLLLVACASQPPRCDRHLTPINAPLRGGRHAGVAGP